MIFLLLAALAVATSIDDGAAAIRWLVRSAPRHPMHKVEASRQMAADIRSAAEEYGIDPYLLTSIAFHESTFRPGARGRLGEIGLVQVARHVRRGCERDGFEMGVPLDQLRCGARHLAGQIKICKSLRGGLTRYATAPPRCRERRKDPVWRKINLRVWMAHKLASRPWRRR